MEELPQLPAHRYELAEETNGSGQEDTSDKEQNENENENENVNDREQERGRALRALAHRVWLSVERPRFAPQPPEQDTAEVSEGAGAVLTFVAPLLLPHSEPHLLHLLWNERFETVRRRQREAASSTSAEATKAEDADGDGAAEEAGRLLEFAVAWVAAYPEDFTSDHPSVAHMADQGRQWQEAMKGVDSKQAALAGRLVLRLEASKVSTLAFVGGGDRMQSLLMRAGSHLRNVAAAQASSSTRRQSLRVLIGQQLQTTLQQSGSPTNPTPTLLLQQSFAVYPDLSQSGPLTSARPSELRVDFMGFDAGAIARELTLIEFGLFYNIRPRELLNQAWQKEDKEKKAPNISLLIARFNEVAFWIATEILQTQGSKMQTVVIKKLVDVASQCYDMSNFNTLMEIISGLGHSSVKRLKMAWKGLDDRHLRRFEELERLMSPLNNFSDYRELLKKRTLEQAEKERERKEKKAPKIVSVPPILPYFALMLRDLTFINEGNPKYFSKDTHSDSQESESESDERKATDKERSDENEDEDDGGDDSQGEESGGSSRHRKDKRKSQEEKGLEINWDLMVMLNQVRLVIQQYQRINYVFVPNHELRRILTSLHYISDENELWDLSQLSFSATREKKTHRRSLSAPLKMKLEALLQHDDRQKKAAREREVRSRLRKECLSDEETQSLDGLMAISEGSAEEEWERDQPSQHNLQPSSSSSPLRHSTNDEDETPSRRKRKGQHQAAASPSAAKEEVKSRWEGGKKKAESMWDQFLHRYFSSHIPSNRENTDSWRFYQSLTGGVDEVLRGTDGEPLRSKTNVRSGLSRSDKDRDKERNPKFKQVADEARRNKKSERDKDSDGSKQRGGSGDFFQQLSGGAKEMLQKTSTTEPPQRRERAHTATDVVSTPTSPSTSSSSNAPSQPISRSYSSSQTRREGSFVLFENLGGGAQAMLKQDVLPATPPASPSRPFSSSSTSSSTQTGPTSPRRSRVTAEGLPMGSSSLPARKGRGHRASLATATSEFIAAQRLQDGAD